MLNVNFKLVSTLVLFVGMLGLFAFSVDIFVIRGEIAKAFFCTFAILPIILLHMASILYKVSK